MHLNNRGFATGFGILAGKCGILEDFSNESHLAVLTEDTGGAQSLCQVLSKVPLPHFWNSGNNQGDPANLCNRSQVIGVVIPYPRIVAPDRDDVGGMVSLIPSLGCLPGFVTLWGRRFVFLVDCV